SSSGLRSERIAYSAQYAVCPDFCVSSVCLCVQLICSAATASLRGRAERCTRRTPPRGVRCGLPHRVPRPSRPSSIVPLHDPACALWSSRRVIPRETSSVLLLPSLAPSKPTLISRWEVNTKYKEPTKRPATARPSEGSTSSLLRFRRRELEKLFSLLRQRPHGHTPRGGRNRPPPR
ncbi:hypothetical protein EVAR_24109_1, partial [Eumeta japonica]